MSLKWKQIVDSNCGTKWHDFFNDIFVVGSMRLKHGGYTLTWEDDRLCRDCGSLVLVTSFLCTQWWALHVLNPFIVLVPVNNGDFLNPKPLLSACRHFTWQELWTNWSVHWINGTRWTLGSTCGVWINGLTSISSWQLCTDTIWYCLKVHMQASSMWYCLGMQRLDWQAQYLPITVNPESRPFIWQPPHSQSSPSSMAWPAPPFHQPTMGEGETWVAG